MIEAITFWAAGWLFTFGMSLEFEKNWKQTLIVFFVGLAVWPIFLSVMIVWMHDDRWK